MTNSPPTSRRPFSHWFKILLVALILGVIILLMLLFVGSGTKTSKTDASKQRFGSAPVAMVEGLDLPAAADCWTTCVVHIDYRARIVRYGPIRITYPGVGPVNYLDSSKDVDPPPGVEKGDFKFESLAVDKAPMRVVIYRKSLHPQY